jgi:hypothetical protein
MMMWWDFKKKEGNPENLWLTLKPDALRNQLDKYEYRIAEILEKIVKRKQFGRWNSISKSARKKRVW